MDESNAGETFCAARQRPSHVKRRLLSCLVEGLSLCYCGERCGEAEDFSGHLVLRFYVV
jgi:hypothetical protein